MGRFLLRIELASQLPLLTRPSCAIGFRWVFELLLMGGFLSHHGIKLRDLVVKRKLKARSIGLQYVRITPAREGFLPRISRIARMGNPSFLIRVIREIRGSISLVAAGRGVVSLARSVGAKPLLLEKMNLLQSGDTGEFRLRGIAGITRFSSPPALPFLQDRVGNALAGFHIFLRPTDFGHDVRPGGLMAGGQQFNAPDGPAIAGDQQGLPPSQAGSRPPWFPGAIVLR